MVSSLVSNPSRKSVLQHAFHPPVAAISSRTVARTRHSRVAPAVATVRPTRPSTRAPRRSRHRSLHESTLQTVPAIAEWDGAGIGYLDIPERISGPRSWSSAPSARVVVRARVPWRDWFVRSHIIHPRLPVHKVNGLSPGEMPSRLCSASIGIPHTGIRSVHWVGDIYKVNHLTDGSDTRRKVTTDKNRTVHSGVEDVSHGTQSE